MTSREVVTLEKYLEKCIEEQRAYFLSRLEAVEKSTCLAAETLEKRLEGMNEFREALKNQNAMFITRAEYSALIDKVSGDVQMLRESKAMLEGKASQQAVNIAMIISVAGLLLGVVSLLAKWR